MASAASGSHDLPRTVVLPPDGLPRLDLAELWRYRDLLILLAGRQIAVRYRQSLLGFGWAVLRPLLTVVVFTVVFGKVVGIGEKTAVPYPLFAFAGQLPWLYFSDCLGNATKSVVVHAGILAKIYFPRIILPLASIGVALTDFAIQFLFLVALMIGYRVTPGWPLLLLPGFLILGTVTALALGLWATALNIRYRDVGHALPFLLQLGMYLTPVVYPAELVGEAYRPLLYLNPMTCVVEGFRWSLLNGAPPDLGWSLLSICGTLGMLASGLCYFQRTERTFADVI